MSPTDLAIRCRQVYDRAAADLGNDLRGFSVRDLCADQIPDVSLSDIEDAIIASGIGEVSSPRICGQILQYAREKFEDSQA